MRYSKHLLILSALFFLAAAFFSATATDSGQPSGEGDFSSGQATHHSHPTVMSLQGSVEGLSSGDLGVKVSDQNSCSQGLVFDHNFSGAISSSLFNLSLGTQYDLNLNYNQDYYMCLYVNGELVGGPNVFIGEEYLENCNYSDPDCNHPWPLDYNWVNPTDPLCQGDGNNDIGCDEYGDNREEVIRAVLHEFGHSFGALADEYDYAWNEDNNSPFNLPPSSAIPNCDAHPCNKWVDVNNAGCLFKCTYDNWCRAYWNTIMRYQYTLTDDYKEVNERALEKVMDEYEFVNSITSMFSYVLNLSYSDGNISLVDVNLVTGKASGWSDVNTSYKISSMSSAGSKLFDLNFEFPLRRYYSTPENWWDENGTQVYDGSTIEDLNSARVILTIPYHNDTETLNVYDENEVLLFSTDVSGLEPVIYSINYGGNKLVATDYNITYSITSQPTTKVIGTDFNIVLG